MMFDLWF